MSYSACPVVLNMLIEHWRQMPCLTIYSSVMHQCIFKFLTLTLENPRLYVLNADQKSAHNAVPYHKLQHYLSKHPRALRRGPL